MAGKFATDKQVLVDAAKEVLDRKEDADGLLKKLNGLVDAVDAFWQGQGHQEFKALNERFDLDVKKLLAALAAISDQLGGTAQAYIAQEGRTGSAMGKIASRMS